MTSATKSIDLNSSSLTSKIAQAAYAVAATVLMLDMREALNAQNTGDQSDAAYTYGL